MKLRKYLNSAKAKKKEIFQIDISFFETYHIIVFIIINYDSN